MTHLFVLRHGIAVAHGTPGVADDDRPLTPKGERRVRQVGRGLKWLGLKVDRIVTSPLPRALRTGEIVADCLGETDVLETTDALRADRGAASIREWLGTREEDRLMIVGHNPAFSDLVGLLAGCTPGRPALELRKAGLAALATGPSADMTLQWLARPRLFRRLGH
jgi:phosphohistidine phosphatase